MLKIATRESALALWQARFVADRLRAAHPDLEVDLVPMTTRGSRRDSSWIHLLEPTRKHRRTCRPSLQNGYCGS